MGAGAGAAAFSAGLIGMSVDVFHIGYNREYFCYKIKQHRIFVEKDNEVQSNLSFRKNEKKNAWFNDIARAPKMSPWGRVEVLASGNMAKRRSMDLKICTILILG